MSVHHTRAYFKAKYVNIIDNKAVGADLAQSYWKPGNSEMFLDVVEKLTGKPLSADAWVQELNQPVKEKVRAVLYQRGGSLAKMAPQLVLSEFTHMYIR